MDLIRIPAGFAPRAAAFVAVAILATVAVTWAALHGLPQVGKVPALKAIKGPTPIVVPDVRREAFVFAKGTLEDAGFAWKVNGKVHGFAANTVIRQSPAPGTKVYDTGAPLVKLTLERNATYIQKGVAEDASPYEATAVVEPSVAPATPAATAAPATAPAATKPVATKTTEAVTPAAPAVPAKPAAPAKTAAPAKAKTSAQAWPTSRPPAFVVAGARKEPLDEMPLTDRAQKLDRWLDAHPKLSSANVDYWLYQNAWIVTGAKFGWWHGADALKTLIAVDQRAEKLWGIGAQSENVAAHALRVVQQKSKPKT
jgi:beta-lactam-binding protein with PASTA domain